MAKVQFYRGLKSKYNPTSHNNGIYFATDTHEIMMNELTYGLSSSDAALLSGSIKNASYTNGVITFTQNDNTTDVTVTIPVATTQAAGLMSSEDKSKINDLFETGGEPNVIEKVQVNGSNLTVTDKTVNIDISGKVDKVEGSSLISAEKLALIDTNASGVAANKTAIEKLNGSGVGSVSKTVSDAITALDLANTYAVKDTESKVSTLESTVGNASSGLVKDVDDLKTTVGNSTSGLVKSVADNTTAIATLNGSALTEGSVNKKVADAIAEIVNENNNGKLDTLNEIAGWIINDTTGAAKMANDIQALQTAVGEGGSVSSLITAEINKLDVDDSATTNQYVSSVSETDGKISVSRIALPVTSVVNATADAHVTVSTVDGVVTVSTKDVASASELNVYMQSNDEAVAANETAVKAAQTTADTGVANAKAAQESANKAQADATKALGDAATAQSAAEAALSTADSAEGKADANTTAIAKLNDKADVVGSVLNTVNTAIDSALEWHEAQ